MFNFFRVSFLKLFLTFLISFVLAFDWYALPSQAFLVPSGVVALPTGAGFSTSALTAGETAGAAALIPELAPIAAPLIGGALLGGAVGYYLFKQFDNPSGPSQGSSLPVSTYNSNLNNSGAYCILSRVRSDGVAFDPYPLNPFQCSNHSMQTFNDYAGNPYKQLIIPSPGDANGQFSPGGLYPSSNQRLSSYTVGPLIFPNGNPNFSTSVASQLVLSTSTNPADYLATVPFDFQTDTVKSAFISNPTPTPSPSLSTTPSPSPSTTPIPTPTTTLGPNDRLCTTSTSPYNMLPQCDFAPLNPSPSPTSSPTSSPTPSPSNTPSLSQPSPVPDLLFKQPATDKPNYTKDNFLDVLSKKASTKFPFDIVGTQTLASSTECPRFSLYVYSRQLCEVNTVLDVSKYPVWFIFVLHSIRNL